MSEVSLKEKTVRGVSWSAADTFLAQGVSFIVGIVLARLLSPEEYGLVGIVTVFTTIMLEIVDSGFSNALIRKNNVTDIDYSTLFFFNFAISVILVFVLFTGAPWIAVFFDRPQLKSLVRVMSLLLIFQATSIVQNTILTRKIDFKTKTKASLISAICSGLIGIGMAFAGCGVWSLAGQQLSRQFIYSICLWMLNKWRPQLNISRNSFGYMWGFGWKLMISGLLDSIWKEIYQVVVGKFYSPADLGQYTRSRQYASLFSINITSIVKRVCYPVLSQMQDNTNRMVNGYRRIIKTTMFITAILMISLGAVAEPLIYCLIGPQWNKAATYLPLICINLSFYPLQAINLNMLQVQGRTDIYLYIEIIKKVMAIGPICLGIFVSIYWMLIGSIFVGFISFFLNSYYSGRSLGYSSWIQLKDIAPSYGIAIIIAASVYFLKFLPISDWLILPIQVFVGFLVLVSVCKLTKLPEYYEVKDIIKTFLDKMHK